MEDEDQNRRRHIVEAVQAQDPTETEAWSDLDALSTQTVVDTVETFIEEIRIDGNTFSGPLLWYVVLHYGSAGEDQLVNSESFPGRFEGHLDNDTPVIDRMLVDVSSFYQ